MNLAAVVLLLAVLYTAALELVPWPAVAAVPAWRRVLTTPNLNKPAP